MEPHGVLLSQLDAEAFGDSRELRRYILEELRRAMGWELTFVTRIDGPNLTITDTSGSEGWLAPSTVPMEATLCFRLLTGEAPPSTDRASDPDSGYADAPACSALGIESYSGHVVRRRDGSVIGTICAIDHGRRLATEHDRRLGETFARLLAWELERESMVEELTMLAHTDGLTGLANRHAFYERLRQEVARAGERDGRLALVVFDVDHFKSVNDAHGHPAGDRVLSEVAARLRATARADEMVARVGGEELAWIMPGVDLDGAWRAAERAREAVAAEPFLDGISITVSAGVAALAQAGVGLELYRLADRALYWAKEQGRDRCLRYAPDIEALSAEDRAERISRSQAVAALRALAVAIDARDPSTQRHSERVADLAAMLAVERGWPVARVALLHEAGRVHDVGKTGVADAVLFKPGRLTADEYEHIKQHAGLGAQIVSDVMTVEQAGWVRHHHERFDGRGYPDRLAGDDIAEGARILALADAWDAMTSTRSYSQPRAIDAAVRECEAEAGGQFCPQAVGALLRLAASGCLATVTEEPIVRA